MITLNELCARLLPSDEQLKFRSLILDEPRMILWLPRPHLKLPVPTVTTLPTTSIVATSEP